MKHYTITYHHTTCKGTLFNMFNSVSESKKDCLEVFKTDLMKLLTMHTVDDERIEYCLNGDIRIMNSKNEVYEIYHAFNVWEQRTHDRQPIYKHNK